MAAPARRNDRENPIGGLQARRQAARPKAPHRLIIALPDARARTRSSRISSASVAGERLGRAVAAQHLAHQRPFEQQIDQIDLAHLDDRGRAAPRSAG